MNNLTAEQILALQKMVDLVKEIGPYEFFKKVNIEESLLQNGFEVEVFNGKRAKNLDLKNQNRVFTSKDSNTVIVLVNAPQNGVFVPILLDKDVYEEKIKGHILYINHSKKECEIGCRVNIKLKDSTGLFRNVKLHRLVMNREFLEDDIQIDHIQHCVFSCLREDLRPVTRYENYANRRFRSHIIKDKNSFRTRLCIDTPEKEEFKNYFEMLGFVFTNVKDNVYICKSPNLRNLHSVYHYLNRIEDSFFGAFRYRPESDFGNAVSTYLYTLFRAGLIDYDQLISSNLVVIEKLYGHSILEYYNVA